MGNCSPDSALWNYTDIIAVAGFGPVYYTEIISNYTFRFVWRVRGLSRISLSYNVLPLFSADASIYVSFSPSYIGRIFVRLSSRQAFLGPCRFINTVGDREDQFRIWIPTRIPRHHFLFLWTSAGQDLHDICNIIQDIERNTEKI